MENIGRNTPASQRLLDIVESIERAEVEKSEIGDHIRAIYANAKSEGFDPKAIRRRIRRRKMKPSDLQEMEALDDVYAHALGELVETPLHVAVSMMTVDITSRAEVIESLKKFVPEQGAIVVEAGGRPVRLVRDERGEVHVKEVEDRPPPQARGAPPGFERPAPEPPPEVDDEGAEQLGRQAFRDNVPIIKNPFPWSDGRRPRWDAGWRAEAAGDGMGPSEED